MGVGGYIFRCQVCFSLPRVILERKQHSLLLPSFASQGWQKIPEGFLHPKEVFSLHGTHSTVKTHGEDLIWQHRLSATQVFSRKEWHCLGSSCHHALNISFNGRCSVRSFPSMEDAVSGISVVGMLLKTPHTHYSAFPRVRGNFQHQNKICSPQGKCLLCFAFRALTHITNTIPS